MSKHPSRPWSPTEVEEQMVAIIDRLDEAVTELPTYAAEAGAAKVDYDLAHAKAMLRSKYEEDLKTVADREAWALLCVEFQYATRIDAETRFDTAKRVIDVLKAQSDLLRSLLVSARGVSS